MNAEGRLCLARLNHSEAGEQVFVLYAEGPLTLPLEMYVQEAVDSMRRGLGVDDGRFQRRFSKEMGRRGFAVVGQCYERPGADFTDGIDVWVPERAGIPKGTDAVQIQEENTPAAFNGIRGAPYMLRLGRAFPRTHGMIDYEYERNMLGGIAKSLCPCLDV